VILVGVHPAPQARPLLNLDLGFLTQPLAHMWLRKLLKTNGQIVADPDLTIEWKDADQSQSRSVH
jgi:hypothetical protein